MQSRETGVYAQLGERTFTPGTLEDDFVHGHVPSAARGRGDEKSQVVIGEFYE